ncbi:MAG: hypothetical protein LBM87_02440 [Ruminococcus sp.]|jgi:hypothetical protein|nr:hypothetical protein [Ruminococcus sp.]
MKKGMINGAATVLAFTCMLTACGGAKSDIAVSVTEETSITITESIAEAKKPTRATETEPEILGSITVQIGSIEDFIGVWQAEESADAPFVSIEIAEGGTVYAYNKRGDKVDSGYADYDEQRALNGNALIVFSFDNLGDYGAYAGTYTDDLHWLDIDFGDKMIIFTAEG